MYTVSQVKKQTGTSARTLQYYDEIGLLKPSKLTISGYRLYDDEALQRLQQIFFLKELGFQLKEIKEILNHPDFDKGEVYKKQKELLLLKRNRIDKLIQLLSRLEEGEDCMSFKEFDLTEYIDALEAFKKDNANDIVEHWGSIENFNLFIQKIKEDEPKLAKLAIKQFGSIEKYTEAMKYNMEHFKEIMDKQGSKELLEVKQKSDELYTKLTSDLNKDSSSDEVQNVVQAIEDFMIKNASAQVIGKDYWNMLIETYQKDLLKNIVDTKYGKGSAAYIVKAFQFFSATKYPTERMDHHKI